MTLILDHINGENHDDRLENLRWVCPNCNQQLPTTGGRNQKRRKKHYYCVDCGKEISRGCIRCKYCNGKSKIVSEENMPIDRNKLKEFIFTIPFTKIGKMFGVTDNAIRKWCKKFNLPFKKEDIIKYYNQLKMLVDWLLSSGKINDVYIRIFEPSGYNGYKPEDGDRQWCGTTTNMFAIDYMPIKHT